MGKKDQEEKETCQVKELCMISVCGQAVFLSKYTTTLL